MDILEIPFHRLLNIKKYQGKENFIFRMEESPERSNHLGTIHACAQLTLAEASSGEYLQQQFQELQGKVVPVVRKTEVKYSLPANGCLSSKASFSRGDKDEYMKEFLSRGRMIVPIKVEVFDSDNRKTLSSVFDWFVTSIPK